MTALRRPAAWGAVAFMCASMAHAQGHGGHGEFDRLVRSAVAHYEAHEARAAIADLERAFAIRPMPRLLYNIGRAHEQAGDWGAAVEYYQRYLDSQPDAEARAVAQEAMDVARRHVAEERQAAAVRLSESTRAREIELARQQAAVEALRRVDAARGGSGATALHRPFTTPVIALWATTGVTAVAAGVLGGLAVWESGQFPSTRQDGARSDLVDRGSAFAWSCNAAIGVAVVTAAVGLVLYLLETPQAVSRP